MRNWSWKDSAELYQVANWGAGFFRINERGHVEVTPRGADGPGVDLYELVPGLQERGLELPLLVRFSDILRSRVRGLVARLRQGDPRVRLQGPLPRRLPDQGQPAAPRRRGDRPLRRAAPDRARGRQQARAAGRAGAARRRRARCSSATATRTRSTSRPRCSRRSWAHADHRHRPLPRARPGDPQCRASSASGRTSACARGSPPRAPASGRSRPATARSSASRPPRSSRRSTGCKAERMLDCLELLHFHLGSQISAIRAHQGRAARGVPDLRRAARDGRARRTYSTSAAASASTTTARRPTSTRR